MCRTIYLNENDIRRVVRYSVDLRTSPKFGPIAASCRAVKDVKAVSEDVIKIIPVDPDFVPKKEIVEKAKSFLEPRHTPSPSASTKAQGRRRLDTLVIGHARKAVYARIRRDSGYLGLLFFKESADDSIEENIEMNSIKMIRELYNLVEETCKKETNIFGYEIWKYHIINVIEYSIALAKKLGANKEIVEISALLHDYASVI
jgi:hypothetical protein